MPAAASMPGLVGRGAELEMLTQAIAFAHAGRGGSFLLSGEPGIGKTALARAFSDAADSRGLLVAWGRAWESGGAPPYWSWIEVLRTLMARCRAETIAAWFDVPGIAVLGGLLPELAQRVPGLAPSPPLDTATMRFQICDAIAGVLRTSGREAALAIVLDDLHAADQPSLEVLRFVVGRVHDAPLVVVGTFRTAEARLSPDKSEILAKTARDARELPLGPLDGGAIDELVKRACLAAAADLAKLLVARTEGNPLFVVETLRLWRARGGRGEAIPDTIRDVVGQRLALLPPDTRRLLELAAAIGRELDLPWLCLAAGMSEAAAREALRPAIGADVIAEPEPDRIVFTHVLIRDGLYHELPAARRTALHFALAEALEKRHAIDPRARAMGLAHHFLEAAPIAGLERALRHAQAAAERAVELHAHEEAVALLGRALSVIDVVGDRDGEADLHRADVLLALGLANMRAHEPERGKAACLEAAAIARARGDADRLARAALALGAYITFGFIDPDLCRLLEEALAAVGPDETPLRARLLARLAAALQPNADPLHPIAIAREAIAIAHRSGDAATLLEVLTSGGSALNYFAEPAERILLTNEMIGIAQALGDEVRQARGLLRLTFDQLEAGDVNAADRAIAEHARIASGLRLPAFTWVVPLLRATRAILDGRFSDAERELASADATAGRPTGVAAQLTLAALRVGLARTRTRACDEAEAELNRLASHIADPWFPLALRASSAALLDDKAALQAALMQARPQIASWRNRQSLAWLADAAVAAGDRALGLAIYPLLAPLAHRCHMWGVAMMVCDGPLSEPLGRLALLLGRHDDAVAHLEDASRRATSMGARPCVARVCLALAQALEARSAGGDAERAHGLVAQVRAMAEALDMPGLRAALDARDDVPARIAVAAPVAFSQPQTDMAFSLVREGELWTVTHAGRYTRLKDSRGLRLLAQLVAEPGREVHVLELLGGGDGGDSGEALDAQAIKAYRTRAADIREQLDEARAHNDLGRGEALQDELESIAQQLSRGVGLGGKARRESSDAERARVNVRRRLVLAIDRISVDLPGLGRHLVRAVKTGVMCVYRPDAP